MTAAPPLLLHPRAWWAAVDNAELVRSLAVGCVFMLVGLLVSTWERVVFFGWGMDEARARGGGGAQPWVKFFTRHATARSEARPSARGPHSQRQRPASLPWWGRVGRQGWGGRRCDWPQPAHAWPAEEKKTAPKCAHRNSATAFHHPSPQLPRPKFMETRAGLAYTATGLALQVRKTRGRRWREGGGGKKNILSLERGA